MNGNARSAGWGRVIVTLCFAVSCLMVLGLMVPSGIWADEFLGNLSVNPYAENSTSNPNGTFGSPFGERSIHNRLGEYGSPFSNRSVSNPHATKAPKLYDRQGRFRGNLSADPYDPDSINNPLGRYGNPLSPDSINNRLGAGNPLAPDSPNNPLGTGWTIRSAD